MASAFRAGYATVGGLLARITLSMMPFSFIVMRASYCNDGIGGRASMHRPCRLEFFHQTPGWIGDPCPEASQAAQSLGRNYLRQPGTIIMNRTEIEAEISLLMSQMENQPEDLHELQLQILARLNEMRAFGLPLPQDLLDLEASLEAEFSQPKGRDT